MSNRRDCIGEVTPDHFEGNYLTSKMQRKLQFGPRHVHACLRCAFLARKPAKCQAAEPISGLHEREAGRLAARLCHRKTRCPLTAATVTGSCGD